MKKIFKGLVCAALLTVTSAATAVPVLTDVSAFPDIATACNFDAGFTCAYTFTTNTAIRVTELGIYDFDLDGLERFSTVGLWDLEGTLLASATLDAGQSGTLIGSFRYVDIADLDLMSGQQYVLGAFGMGDVFDDAHAITVNPAITISDEGTFLQGSFGFPTNLATPPRALLAANMNIEVLAVPEPSTLALFTLAMLGVTFRYRR